MNSKETIKREEINGFDNIQKIYFEKGIQEGKQQTLKDVLKKINTYSENIEDFDCSKEVCYDTEYDDDNKGVALQVLGKLKAQIEKQLGVGEK